MQEYLFFPRPSIISALSQFKYQQKLPKMVNNITNFLLLHLGKKNHENLTQNSSYRCFHSHFYASFSRLIMKANHRMQHDTDLHCNFLIFNSVIAKLERTLGTALQNKD